MSKENLREKIESKKKELAELEFQLEKETPKTGILDVPELGIEVEIEVSYKGYSYDKIMALPDVQNKIKNGWRLLCTIRPVDYVNEVAFLENNSIYSKILKMNGSSTKDDFFVSQMYKRNSEKGYVAYFYANSGKSGLNSVEDSDDSYSIRGVRFCRKKIFRGKKK